MISLVLALVASLSAQASPAAPKMYELALEVKKDGQLLAAPRLSVIEGETASITQQTEKGHTFVEVLAKERTDKTKGVLVAVTVGEIDAKGKRKIVAEPQIMALENETASMTVKEKKKKGKDAAEVSVSVMASSPY